MIQRKMVFTLLAAVIIFIFAVPLNAAGKGEININTASIEQLEDLSGVGEKYAQQIIEHREANGAFEKPEDIMKVKGIGAKIWEANKDRIVVE